MRADLIRRLLEAADNPMLHNGTRCIVDVKDAREAAAALAPQAADGGLVEACRIGLAIAGHFHPDTPVDPWLAAHEKRLRELEKLAALPSAEAGEAK